MKIKIAENIKKLRKAHALTQEQLAEALGVTVGAVYKWEAGLSNPELKLIMELADFFEVSIDVLLGYEQQSSNIEGRVERIRQCVLKKDFEEAVIETEKALKKYPNNFDVTYMGARMYMLKFSEDKCKATMQKSNRLFQNAIALLSQNTDKRVNEAAILNYIASNYLTAGETEHGLEILKKNNVQNINSSLIGYTYAAKLKKPAEAGEYLYASLAEIINTVIRTTVGMAFMYAELKDETCISAALWLSDFFDSLKENETEITFLDKFKAILLAQCAVWENSFRHMDKAKEFITNAYQLAQQFDASPIYTMQGIKFFDKVESKGVSIDGIGKTAMDAVENYVFGENGTSDAYRQIKEIWEELKNGCAKTT